MSTTTRSSKRSGSGLSSSARKYQKYNPEDLQEDVDLDFHGFLYGSQDSVPTTVEEKYAELALQDRESITTAPSHPDPITAPSVNLVPPTPEPTVQQNLSPTLISMLGRIVANQEKIIELLQKIEAQQRHFADSEKAWTETLNATKTSLIELHRQSAISIAQSSQNKPGPMLQAPTSIVLQSSTSEMSSTMKLFSEFF
nr:TPA_asm: hypothetical protein 2 [Taeniapi tapwovirus]